MNLACPALLAGGELCHQRNQRLELQRGQRPFHCSPLPQTHDSLVASATVVKELDYGNASCMLHLPLSHRVLVHPAVLKHFHNLEPDLKQDGLWSGPLRGIPS